MGDYKSIFKLVIVENMISYKIDYISYSITIEGKCKPIVVNIKNKLCHGLQRGGFIDPILRFCIYFIMFITFLKLYNTTV
ncbi:hypothetical protein C0J52_09543 [Blattella germanica]|nr:hypothetical protein C0J52_09543 [Blattella germanica]